MNSALPYLIANYGPEAKAEGESPAVSTHKVARCIWDTAFDDPAAAVSLQNALSRWSNTELDGLLERAFQRFCPSGQTWRIGKLELDLGEILLDDLSTELPKRVQAALYQQLGRLLDQSEQNSIAGDTVTDNLASHNHSQIVDSRHTLNEVIEFFLETGAVPWWYSGGQSQLSILQQQLEQTPQSIAAVIRSAGQSESVRKRIAWQYENTTLHKIVRVLEPQDHEYIIAFTRHLQDRQAKTQQPTSDRSGFVHKSWFWVLTHLLVERGSLFNTVAFVESTLRQMAHSYRLDFAMLLQQLVSAAHSLEMRGGATPQFIEALLSVRQNNPTPGNAQAADKHSGSNSEAATPITASRSPSADNQPALNKVVAYFLETGALPGWYSGGQSQLSILLQQLEQTPQSIAAIIRSAGQTESVRKRIAWQYQDTTLHKIVRVLEPQDHEYIIAFTRHLQDRQVKAQQPTSDRSGFVHQSWFWVLTHLLVERGSLFNTVAFVESTLRQMAHSYRLDFAMLLQQLVSAAQSLETRGGAMPQFIQALLSVRQNNPTPGNAQAADKHSGSNSEAVTSITASHSPSADNQPALNKVVAYFLETGALPGWYGGGQSQLSILLQQLEQTPQPIAAIIRSVGRIESVRKRIAWQYENTTINKIVQVLEPQDHEYIIAFTRHLQDRQVKTQQPTSDRSGFVHQSWFWVLTHLLVERGSLFNTVAFVESTLRQMAHSYRLDFAMLLQQLVSTAQSLKANGGSRPAFILALLNIQEKAQTQSGQTAATQPAEVYRQALAAYFADGQAPKVIGRHYLPAATQMFSILLYRHPEQWSLLATEALTAGPATDTRIRRLLELIQPADFSVVLNALDAQAGRFAASWTALLSYWHSRQWLPSLSGFDCHHEMQCLVLRLLINKRGAGSGPAQFLSAFFAGLINRYGVDGKRLAAEIESGSMRDGGKRNKWPKADENLFIQWLSDNRDRQADPSDKPVEPDGEAVGLVQQTITLLRRNGNLSSQPAENGQGASVSELLAAIIPAHADLLLAMLQRQTDRQRLAQTLLEQTDRLQLKPWLDGLWPSVGASAPEFLAQWQAAIWKSGLWHGEEKALQALLQKAFDLSALDRTLLKPDKTRQDNAGDFLEALVQASCISLQIETTQLAQHIDLKETLLWESAFEADKSPVSDALTGKTESHLEQKQPQPATFEQAAHNSQSRRLPSALLAKLCGYFLAHGRLPLWLSEEESLDLPQIIEHLIRFDPQRLQQAIKPIRQRPEALFRLQNALSFKDLLEAVRLTTAEAHSTLTMLAGFFQGLARLRFDRVSSKLLQAVLWRKVLHAWLNGEWQSLNPQSLLREFSGELIRRYQLPIERIEAEFVRHKQHFPVDCHSKIFHGLKNAQIQPRPTTVIDKAAAVPAAIKPPDKNKLASAMPFHLSNAGLVLLQGFIAPYFSRLALIENQAFCNEQAQRHAVHALQYLATGLTATEEQHLILNKVLCGLLPATPVEPGIDLSDKDKETANSLITAAVDYWPAIGSSSVDGFRGNWLVRNGLLSFSEERWELRVEKRPYDLLLQSAPFSFGLIKLPWMTIPLYVTWPV